jgi:hypothetical protein
MAVISIIPGEDKDLELHVNLCQQRYTELSEKIDRLDLNLKHTADTLLELKDLIMAQKEAGIGSLNRWIIIALSSVVGILLSANGWLIVNYIGLIGK